MELIRIQVLEIVSRQAGYLQLLYIQGRKINTEPRVYIDRNFIRKGIICGAIILEIIDHN